VAMLYSNIEKEFRDALIGIGSETYSCAPTPVQIAARAAYRNYNGAMEYVSSQVNILKQIGDYCYENLNEVNIRTHAPEGAFYLFSDFSLYKQQLVNMGITTSVQLCNVILMDTGVALLPASAFGFQKEYMAVRLAYVDFDDCINKKNLNFEKDFPRVLEGIKLIKSWVSKLL
ncbi:MAG: aminotransferase class I/II-fold pyridoxal phosphate-dependent enzyme, partial [Eudoraea sp.]|nr:aminotransferase class I/II-fold pyridoxal phosphate-dependent enzyme [Eudoraea sp.]